MLKILICWLWNLNFVLVYLHTRFTTNIIYNILCSNNKVKAFLCALYWSTWHKLQYLLKRIPQLKDYLNQTGLLSSLHVILLINDLCRKVQLIVGSANRPALYKKGSWGFLWSGNQNQSNTLHLKQLLVSVVTTVTEKATRKLAVLW